MPFDEEDDDSEQPSSKQQRVGLKKVSTQKSIFENAPKKPSQEDLEKKVQNIQEQNSSYKSKAASLAIMFKKTIEDKTLPQNKNIFSQEMERELLANMINLAVEINNDIHEQEGMGSLIWMTLVFKTLFIQRDKINCLEYALSQLEKKTEPANYTDFISKEITKALDKKKISE